MVDREEEATDNHHHHRQSSEESSRIRQTVSWDEQRLQHNQRDQDQDNTGESRSHHPRHRSWSGTLVGLAQDVLNGSTAAASTATGSAAAAADSSSKTTNPNSRPPLPRPLLAQRRHSASGQEDFHRKNQLFLQQAAAVRQQLAPPSLASPSPNTKFRKRLQLKAIEESDGHSFVVVQNQSGNMSSSLAPTNASDSQSYSIMPSPPASPHFASTNDGDEYTTTTINFVPGGNGGGWDNDSVVSSLGGSVHYESCHKEYSTTTSQTNHFVAEAERQRLAKFEQEQEERFQLKKRDMEQKLSQALKESGIPETEDVHANELVQTYLEDLERERIAMLEHWKAEMRLEEEWIRQEALRQRLFQDFYDGLVKPCMDPILVACSNAGVVFSNMPVTIGALGFSWATMGVLWFKIAEEMIESCHHVNYLSDSCTVRELPGCFECDTSDPRYKIALCFHWICSTVSGIACTLFILKVILAPNAVLDMLKNPTTSTPVGVWCLAMVGTFAGVHGTIGEVIVFVTSSLHAILAFWYLYTAFFKFRLWADPGWFPNIVGMNYVAVKTFTYFPETGLCLMALCVSFFVGMFFVSVVRVALNQKIATNVCLIQLSAPSTTLYTLTLLSQPGVQEGMFSVETKQKYLHFLQYYYMPSQHFFMLLTIVGLISTLHAIWTRWSVFKMKPFSPAHVAFCFTTLSHANAIQAYRTSLTAYSSLPFDHPVRRLLFGYLCFFICAGTILNVVFSIKYILRIPDWTRPDVTGEEEPPAHGTTIVDEIMRETDAHEIIWQPFVSPAVLEANEAGVIIRVRQGTEDFRLHGPFMRTRNVWSLGFDPILSELELRDERAHLLEWVAMNALQARNMSENRRDAYGTFSDLSQAETLLQGHTRSKGSN